MRQQLTTPFRKKATDRTRRLRTLILATGSLGGLSLLLTVTPSSNPTFNYLRATTALNVGNLSGATAALLALPHDSAEGTEIIGLLFPRLLEAREYSPASHVCFSLFKSRDSACYTYADRLWRYLIFREGLEKAFAIRSQFPELQVCLPDVPVLPLVRNSTTGAIDNEMLERVLPHLRPEEKHTLARELARYHLQRKNLTQAWRWTTLLPPEKRKDLVDRLVRQSPRLALEVLNILDSTPYSDWLRTDAMGAVAAYAPNLAPHLLKTIKDPDLIQEARRQQPIIPIRITPTR